MNASNNYGLYVTPGKDYHNVKAEWGGSHITIAGFSSKNNNLSAMQSISSNSMQSKIQWKPSSFTILNWKGKWTLVINQDKDTNTLKKIGETFGTAGFQNVKNPRYHITLNVKSMQDAKNMASKLLKEKSWFLTSIKSCHKCSRHK